MRDRKRGTLMSQEYQQLLLKNQICFPLYACSRKIVAAYTPYLKPLGLTYTQYIVFMVLWEEETVNVGQLLPKKAGTLRKSVRISPLNWLRKERL